MVRDVDDERGHRIKARRLAHWCTQERRAERAAVSAVFLSNLEPGKRNQTLTVLVRRCEALELSLADLVADR
jgi:transcriptional regulator with XRE-family HTH domain